MLTKAKAGGRGRENALSQIFLVHLTRALESCRKDSTLLLRNQDAPYVAAFV